MSLPSDLANDLRWIIETTRDAPYLGRAQHQDRMRVEREYRLIHEAATRLDNHLRNWKSIRLRQDSAP